MSRASASTVACLAAAALLVACSSSSGGAPGAGAYREPVVVQFTYQAVSPETVHIPAGGNLTWKNIAADTRGFVIFPASIASAFRCQDLRPYFVRMETVYRSLPLTDEESERVQLPCPLAPGSYDYEIWLMGSGFGVDFGDGKPEQILRAKIVVE